MRATMDRDLGEVRRTVLSALRPYKAEVVLFGSWARGDRRRWSDIDVGVRAKRRIPELVLANLRERLEESCIPYRVEVVDLSTVGSTFLRNVRRDGIVWRA